MLRKFLVFLVALAMSGMAQAALISRAPNGDSLRLLETPCTDTKVLSFIPDEHKARFQSAVLVMDKVTYAGCWATQGPVILAVYEDGDMGQIPMQYFEKEDPI